MSQYTRCCVSQLKNIIPTQHLYVNIQAGTTCYIFDSFLDPGRAKPLLVS
nr:MAG TPA: hypothetical protein [Caudoviricetes sp.]